MSIPLLKEGKNNKTINKLNAHDTALEAYAQVFINYFAPRFNNNFGAYAIYIAAAKTYYGLLNFVTHCIQIVGGKNTA